MSGKPPPKQPRSEADIREDRLKQALKANLARRKAQARVRGDGKAGNEGGPDTGGEQKG